MSKVIITVMIIFLAVLQGKGQLDTLSLSLLAQQQSSPVRQHYYSRPGNGTNLMQTHQKNIVAAYNPVSLTFKGLMFLYQNVLSQQLSKECPYYYTCSNYAKLAIHEYGFFKGILLAGDRIMRCNRISLLDVNNLSVDEASHTIIDDPSMY